jgi:hypothetical protein
LTCLGEGTIDGERCDTCMGSGSCIICGGDGQLGLGTLASVEAEETGGPRTAQTVGGFLELGYEGAPSLAALRGKRSDDHLAEVVAYLRAGKLLVMSPGLVHDPLEPGRLAGKRSMRTDGVFAWPDSLAYFVERYRVELPAAFEHHMARSGWTMPEAIDITDLRPT